MLRAANAEEALHVLKSDASIDVLLSDVVMPGGINGVELAKQAEQLRPGIKILLSSGYAGETLEESLAHGGDWPFLRKPYLASELADALAGLRGPGGDDRCRTQMSRPADKTLRDRTSPTRVPVVESRPSIFFQSGRSDEDRVVNFGVRHDAPQSSAALPRVGSRQVRCGSDWRE